MRTHSMRARLLKAGVSAPLLFAFLLTPRAIASDEPQLGRSHASWEVPETREENLRLADEYRQQAAQLRLNATMHRGMRASYAQQLTPRPTNAVKRWWAEQRPHCDRLIRAAEGLATEMETFSTFYAARAADAKKD